MVSRTICFPGQVHLLVYNINVASECNLSEIIVACVTIELCVITCRSMFAVFTLILLTGFIMNVTLPVIFM